jgi:uncharacterized protein YjdB
MNRKNIINGLAGCAALAFSFTVLACLDRNYDNPFLSDSDSISEEWKRDLNDNGIADSVEFYANNCNGTPAECLRLAIENAATQAANHGVKGDTTVVVPPKDTTVIVPPKDTTVVVPPKDTTVVVPPKDTTVVVPPKDTTVVVPPKDTIVVVPPRDTIRDTIVVPPKVTAVTGIEAQAIYIPMGVLMARPSVTILPRDAANQGYTLQSMDETTVKVSGMDLVPVKPGSATIKARSDDGGFTVQFLANVLVTDTNRYETAVSVEAMELVADAPAQAPVVTWTPTDVSNRSYALTSSDPGKVLVVMEGGVAKCKPIAAGKADVTLKTLGKGLTAVFSVTVKPAPLLTIPVLSISAQDLGLVLGGSDLAPEVTYFPLLATNRGYTLKSDNVNVVSVSGAKLHAVSGGNANITITSLDGPSSVFKAGVTVRATAVSAADAAVVLGSAKFTPVVTFTPASTTNKTYTLKSDAPTVVSVVGSQLQAVAGGTATILLTSTDGPVATFKVTVTVRATSISVADVAMALGSPDVTPVVSFVPAAATNKAYTLSSASPGVVSVSGTQLHAVSGGTSVITVTAADGPKTTFKATVSVGLTAISAEDAALTLGGADVTPVVAYTPASATNKTYTLKSDAPTVVSVVGNKLRAVSAGSATITITSAEGPKSTFTATVTTPVTLVTAISAEDMSLNLGGADASPTVAYTPAAATNKAYALVSDEPTVVSVVGTKLHAVSPGTATITITSVDGPSSTFTATVPVPVTAVTAIAAADVAMLLGAADVIPVISYTPTNATNKAYTLVSDAPTVVSVVAGKLHAVAAGTATITITSADGPSSTFTATVEVPVTPVTAISAGDVALVLGGANVAPVIAYTPANATHKAFTLTSEDPTVVSVVGTQLHAVAGGSAIITITSVDGPSSTFNATVRVPVQTITAPDLAMVDGDKVTVAPVFTPADAANTAFTMKADTSSIVTVRGHELEAKKEGVAIVTMTATDGGATSTFTVTVSKKGEPEPDPEPVPTE